MKKVFSLLFFFFCTCLVPQYLSAATGTITGTVTDSVTHLPISGAVVEAIKGGHVRYSDITALDGTYSLTNVIQANYTLVFSATGYQSQAVGVRTVNNQTIIVDVELVPIGGTISGTVIDATTAASISGATIRIFQGTELIRLTSTNGIGFYTIPNLAPGNYIVEATAIGYQTQSVGASVQPSTTTTVDFALLLNPGSITGFVIDSITTNPIGGALIEVFNGSVLMGFADTDGNGNYTVLDLAPGSYTITASAEGYQSKTAGAIVISNTTTIAVFALDPPPGTIAGTVIDASTANPIPGATVNFFQGVTLIASVLTDTNGQYSVSEFASGNYIVTASKATYQTQAVGATVAAGATTIVNFALQQPPGMISGTVTDALTTNPIEGARVSVFSGQIFIGLAITDVNGNYSIPNLAPGQYTVLADAGANFQIASQGATVVASMTTTVNFALQPNPGTISGTVTNGANGIPILGASILVLNNFTIIDSAVTDANGNYSITGLAPGNYSVIASAPNFSIAVVGASVTANHTTIVNFALKADLGKIFGTVTDASTNSPIAGATVQVRNNFIVVATAITDANGNYNFPNLAPDTYTVTASAPGFQRQIQIATVNSNQVTIVNFSLNSNPGAISGTVTDALTTNPIPNATIAVFQGTTFIDYDLTDVNGNYIIPDLAPGDYTVLAIAHGFQSAFSVKTVVAGMTTIADFALKPNPGAIAGTVTDGCTGSPLPGTSILVTTGSMVEGFGLTDPNGNYSIDTLAPGNYIVTAAKKNFLIGSSSAIVTANATTIVNFSLQPTIFPAASIFGCSIKNKFLNYTDLVHIISWTASPSSCVIGYQIFRNGDLIAFVPSTSKLEYQDHDRNKKTDIYSVNAVNVFDAVSDAVIIILDDKSECRKKKSK